MSIEMIIKMVVAMLGEYLLKPLSAAKYGKWFITARDYLNLLFPVAIYPTTLDTEILDKSDKYVVPPAAVVEAAKKKGFNIPFIRGI